MADDKAPIIIKKVKKGGHGHHGGAWKVAYADFVTAMMAFFLLLWLLSSTSESQKEGIAEYFTPTIGLKDEMGIGFDGGESPSEEGKSKSDLMPPGIVSGQVQPGQAPDNPEQTLIDGETESNLFEKAEEAMRQALESDPNLRELTENILMEQTPEGLKIELRDDDKHPMFEAGSTKLSAFGEKLLTALTPVVKKMPNHLSVTGHTDATAFQRADGYSNWELSADRANSARRFLRGQGLEEDRVAKIIGRGAQDLLLPETPSSPRNRRIEIILLRGSHLKMEEQYQPAPRSLLSPPSAADTLRRLKKSQALPGGSSGNVTQPSLEMPEATSGKEVMEQFRAKAAELKGSGGAKSPAAQPTATEAPPGTEPPAAAPASP